MSELSYLGGKESSVFYAVTDCSLLVENYFLDINYLIPAARENIFRQTNIDIHCKLPWCLKMNVLNCVDGKPTKLAALGFKYSPC